jgi:hypothetical protein
MMRNVSQGITILTVLALLAGTTLAERKERKERPERPEACAQAPDQGSRHQGPRGTHGRRPGGEHGGSGRFVEQMLKPETARKLGLEAAQVKKLKQGLARVQKQEKALHAKLAAAGREQAKLLMAKGKVDEAAIMKAVDKTGRLRTQMAKLRIRPILLVKQTLTAEQIETAHKMMRKRMQGGRRDGAARRREVAKDEVAAKEETKEEKKARKARKNKARKNKAEE